MNDRLDPKLNHSIIKDVNTMVACYWLVKCAGRSLTFKCKSAGTSFLSPL